jgi:hypothetical protein
MPTPATQSAPERRSRRSARFEYDAVRYQEPGILRPPHSERYDDGDDDRRRGLRQRCRGFPDDVIDFG